MFSLEPEEDAGNDWCLLHQPKTKSTDLWNMVINDHFSLSSPDGGILVHCISDPLSPNHIYLPLKCGQSSCN